MLQKTGGQGNWLGHRTQFDVIRCCDWAIDFLKFSEGGDKGG
jgi:excinuclease UvrABC ATPase subunit